MGAFEIIRSHSIEQNVPVQRLHQALVKMFQVLTHLLCCGLRTMPMVSKISTLSQCLALTADQSVEGTFFSEILTRFAAEFEASFWDWLWLKLEARP